MVAHLGSSVTIRPYEAIFGDIQELSKATLNEANNSDKVTSTVKHRFTVSNKTSWALSQSLGGEEKVEEVRSPIGDAKAVKNETELNGMRACHIRDGAALIEYFAWLEDQLLNQKAKLDEVEGADRLEQMRSY